MLARETLNKWRKERRKLALKVAFRPSGSQSLTVDSFENEFANYISKDPDMTALWGFAVITYLNESEFDEDGVKGPLKPAHGYLRYVKATGIGDQGIAWQWATGDRVNHSVDQICPK